MTGIQLPFWPVWLASRGLTASEIGLLFAAAIVGQGAGDPRDRSGSPTGPAASRRLIMAGLAGAALVAYAGLWPVGPFGC